MSKQTNKAIGVHLAWSGTFVAVLFIFINTMPRALGQRHSSNTKLVSQAPRLSNVNGAVPAAARMPNARAAASPSGRRRGPEGVCPSTITQSLSQEIASDNSVACNNGTATAQNSFWRAFDMSTFTGGRQYDVTSVSFGIESAISGSGTGQPLTVNLYIESSAPFPNGTRTLLATSGSINIPDQAYAIFNVPIIATVPAGTTNEPTFPMTRQRLDYIFCDAKWSDERTEVVHRGPSDHWPLVAYLTPLVLESELKIEN